MRRTAGDLQAGELPDQYLRSYVQEFWQERRASPQFGPDELVAHLRELGLIPTDSAPAERFQLLPKVASRGSRLAVRTTEWACHR